MLLKYIIYKGIETISAIYPEGEAREMVFAYMEDVFGIGKLTHILDPDRSLPEPAVQKALADFGRMASGEPLQYVTGVAHFYGRKFCVTPDVLIPRQETELLCNELLYAMASKATHSLAGDGIYSPPPVHSSSQQTSPLEILDMCTGSGCIAWTLALEMPLSKVTALDISDGALAVASEQDFAEEMSRTGAVKPRFIKADVLRSPEEWAELWAEHIPDNTASNRSGEMHKFDIIVSNPPYVMDSEKAAMRTNVLDHEPHLALFVPDEDPLKFYRAVAEWSVKLLKEDGVGMVEINEALGCGTAEVFSQMGFGYTEIVRDLHEKDRFVRFSKVPFSKKNRFF